MVFSIQKNKNNKIYIIILNSEKIDISEQLNLAKII